LTPCLPADKAGNPPKGDEFLPLGFIPTEEVRRGLLPPCNPPKGDKFLPLGEVRRGFYIILKNAFSLFSGACPADSIRRVCSLPGASAGI